MSFKELKGSEKSLSFPSNLKSDSIKSFNSRSSVNALVEDKRYIYRIIEDGVDVTPDNMVDPDYVMMERTDVHAAFASRPRTRSQVSKSSMLDIGMKVYATTINLDDIHIDHTMNTEEGVQPEEVDLEKAPSAFSLPKRYPLMSYPPSINIVLKETETEFLFEFLSSTCEKGTPEGNQVEQDNEFYSYITVGKGRNRKMVLEETQTNSCITQSRHTMATRPQKKNAAAFASMWDMYDTYEKLARQQAVEEPDEMVMYQSAAPHLLRRRKPQIVTAKDQETLVNELALTPQFQDAVLLTERVLAASEYGDQQKIFRGLRPMNPFALDLIYIYTLTPLWTLECEESAGRPITCVCFNSKNQNILAVSYGRFVYADKFDGLICIWCTKNPCKPERIYKFPVPVTSVAFSNKNPNWLACGFGNGDVLILDIVSYSLDVVARSKRDSNPCFEPIWSIMWRLTENRDTEYVMTSSQDGRINKFIRTKTNDFICTLMMRVSCVEGKVKGQEVSKPCLNNDVPITRYPAALCCVPHPRVPHLYFVGTDEGCLHRCSTHYVNQHIDVHRAHAGPVYTLQASPFMKTLFVSCGADNTVRLWLEGIDDVILTLPCPAAVYSVTWCPVNSTILVSVSKSVVSVWDLRRKTHMPCAEHTFPGAATLTYVAFSESGDNVFVADTLGRVHTFHLQDTPIPPYYQYKLLDETIRKALCTRPHLLRQLEKLLAFSGRT